MLIILALIALTNAKCVVYRDYSHTSNEKADGYYNKNYLSAAYWAMAWGFGFEHLSHKPGCDDLEMFYQCQSVQKALDNIWLIDLINKVNTSQPKPHSKPDLKCHEDIVCLPDLPEGNGVWFCENLNSYDKCLQGQKILDGTIYSEALNITCNKTGYTGNTQVLSYRKPIVTENPTPMPTGVPTFSPTASTTIADNVVLTTAPQTSDVGKLYPYIIWIIMLLNFT